MQRLLIYPSPRFTNCYCSAPFILWFILSFSLLSCTQTFFLLNCVQVMACFMPFYPWVHRCIFSKDRSILYITKVQRSKSGNLTLTQDCYLISRTHTSPVNHNHVFCGSFSPSCGLSLCFLTLTFRNIGRWTAASVWVAWGFLVTGLTSVSVVVAPQQSCPPLCTWCQLVLLLWMLLWSLSSPGFSTVRFSPL